MAFAALKMNNNIWWSFQLFQTLEWNVDQHVVYKNEHQMRWNENMIKNVLTKYSWFDKKFWIICITSKVFDFICFKTTKMRCDEWIDLWSLLCSHELLKRRLLTPSFCAAKFWAAKSSTLSTIKNALRFE